MPEYKVVRLPYLYFPPVSWFVAYNQAEQVIPGSAWPYRKQTYRNRCRIYSSNGVMTLSVPVKKLALSNSFERVITDPTREWRRNHWRTIESAYNRSPFFLYYKDGIEPFFRGEEESISLKEWNRETLLTILAYLNLDPAKLTLQVDIDAFAEMQDKSDEIIDFSALWLNKGKELQNSFTSYQQVFSDRMPFAPDLSILDLLFNLGPESRVYLEQQSLSLQEFRML